MIYLGEGQTHIAFCTQKTMATFLGFLFCFVWVCEMGSHKTAQAVLKRAIPLPHPLDLQAMCHFAPNPFSLPWLTAVTLFQPLLSSLNLPLSSLSHTQLPTDQPVCPTQAHLWCVFSLPGRLSLPVMETWVHGFLPRCAGPTRWSNVVSGVLWAPLYPMASSDLENCTYFLYSPVSGHWLSPLKAKMKEPYLSHSSCILYPSTWYTAGNLRDTQGMKKKEEGHIHIYPEKVLFSDVLYVDPTMRRGRQEKHKEVPSASSVPGEPADLVIIFWSRSLS